MTSPSEEHLEGSPWIDPGERPELVRALYHLDTEIKPALERWALDQDRSASAQLRVVLRDAIPDRYFERDED